MQTTTAPLVRNLAAEIRFAEEGHRCHVLPSGAVKVVSDTIDGKWYEVHFGAGNVGDLVMFGCDPRGADTYREGHLSMRSPEPGVVPCKHAAGAARRLEREGIIELSAEGWRATDVATISRPTGGDDPFAGLT